MLWITAALMLAPAPPLAERVLHAGHLARGEQELEAALAAAPKDDQLRFGLGVVQFARAAERLAQALHEYGVKPEAQGTPFLRLPVPANPDPAPASYAAVRRIVEDFRRDLGVAELTLAGVRDDGVKLPLRLAAAKFDLDADGTPTDKLVDLLKPFAGRGGFDFLKANPEFAVTFDRADVAWLRGYCHLLMALADFTLSHDGEAQFDESAGRLFAKPKLRARPVAERKSLDTISFREPARLARARRHLLKVAELNRETWAFARAETDDDREWLPNARQTGALGLPVRDDMVDAWLAMVAEVEAALKGERTFLAIFLSRDGQGLNLKTLLDDPPASIGPGGLREDLPAKYFFKAKDLDLVVLIRAWRAFGDTMAFAYAGWFN